MALIKDTQLSGSSPSDNQGLRAQLSGGPLKLKVCGMKYVDNIRDVAVLSPDFMGFIFYPKSKRYVGEDFVMPDIPSEIKKVGVFVNEKEEIILDKVKRYNLDFVQLHGDESVDYCSKLFQRLKLWKNCGIIKAFGVDPQFNFSILKEYENSCEYFLFDTKTKEYGGSGKSFDKNILADYKLSKPYFLSGGIGSDIFSELKTIDSRLAVLDVNSKFETEPGLKDINKLKILKDELSGK